MMAHFLSRTESTQHTSSRPTDGWGRRSSIIVHPSAVELDFSHSLEKGQIPALPNSAQALIEVVPPTTMFSRPCGPLPLSQEINLPTPANALQGVFRVWSCEPTAKSRIALVESLIDAI